MAFLVVDPAVAGWGGQRGDATDQVFYFTYGVGDALLLGTPRYFRQSVYGDDDQVDDDGNAYYAGRWGGTAIDLVSGAAVVKTGGKQLLKRLGHETIGEGMEALAKRCSASEFHQIE